MAAKYHWDAHRSNPANFFAAILGMIVNNCIVLWGLWAMLFDGKPNGHELTLYFLALNAMVTISWGGLDFFLGGMRRMPEFIERGSFEVMMGTPRSPLLLTSISQSSAPALGDILQGLCNLVVLFFLSNFISAARCLLLSSITAIAFFSVFIFTGALPFFFNRSSQLATLLVECTLSLSFYPSSKIFMGSERFFLYLTPALLTTVLPMQAWEQLNWSQSLLMGLTALILALLFLKLAIVFFKIGLSRYQTSNAVGLHR